MFDPIHIYYDGEMIKDNVVKIKYDNAFNSPTGYSKNVRIINVQPKKEGVSEKDESFQLLNMNEFSNLKTTKGLTDEEL
jgi:hypothetical protein